MIRTIATLLFLATLTASPAVFAEDAKKATVVAKPAASSSAATIKGIGVVDTMALLRESSAAKSIEKQLNERRKTYRDQLAAQEKKLQATEEELTKNRKTMKAEEFETKRKAFEKSVRELQKNAQQKHIAFDKAATGAVAKLQAKITEITAKIAREKKLQLVLTRDQVVVVEQNLDITKDVMTALNKEMPSLSVKAEEKK